MNIRRLPEGEIYQYAAQREAHRLFGCLTRGQITAYRIERTNRGTYRIELEVDDDN